MSLEKSIDLEHIVNTAIDDACQQFIDNGGHDEHSYLALENDINDVIKNFVENYSSPSLGIVKGDDLDAEQLKDFFLSHMTKKQFVELLFDCASSYESDYYVKYNEIFSMEVGEIEFQIDVDDLDQDSKDLIASATDEELDEAGLDRVSFWVYGVPCGRWIWTVDPSLLLEKYRSLKFGRKKKLA